MLTEIPPAIPPWLRAMYEVEQMLALAVDDSSPAYDPISTDDVGRMLGDDAETVVWVWNDWSREPLLEMVKNDSYLRSGGIEELDAGRHIEVMLGGRSGLPSVVFPSGDPAMFLEAQPFQKQELLGQMNVLRDRYFDRRAPVEHFTIQAPAD